MLASSQGVICRSLLLVGTALLAVASARADANPPRTWRFDVALDGRPIGEHEFVATAGDGVIELVTRARFKVRVLGIPLYRYEHDNREVWRDGCVMSIDAYTVDNGEEFSVRGARSGDRFEVRGPKGALELAGCVKTFAYWDPSFLGESRLLNSQTGEYDAVVITYRGRETYTVNGRAREADRHTVRSAALEIDLWYSPQGEWLGLESRTPEGRKLRYELR